MSEDWLPPGATKDEQSVTADWERTDLVPIEGVRVHEIQAVPRANRVLTEVYRADWDLDGGGVEQAFYSTLVPGAISGWHAHGLTTDRLFVPLGRVELVLYDSRPGSTSYGRLNQLFLSDRRPTLVVIPPRVWHAVRNVAGAPSLLMNLVDRAYAYEDPDHYRLPLGTPEIPFTFDDPTGT